jgi:CDP-4-dehydro-6-deoxyglucose reductase
MTHRIRLQPSGHEFDLEGRESILEAALRAGVHLDHRCAAGNCGQCMARLVSGAISPVRHNDYRFSAEQKTQGCFLACSNTAANDIVIEAAEAASAADVPLQTLRATVKRSRRVTARFSLLRLQTPRTQLLRFLAGQRVRLVLTDTGSREFHVASCPCDGRNLDLLVPHDETGDPVAAALTRLSPGTTLALEGPRGDFVLDEESRRPHVFIALDAGLGPILSLVEQAIAVGRAGRIDLFRVDDCERGSYLDNLCRSWRDGLDNFDFHCLDETLACMVIAQRLAAAGCLRGAEVYLAGPASRVNPLAAAIAPHTLRLHSELTG